MDNPIARMAGLVAAFQARAARLDATSSFPAENIADLRSAGALAAVLPTQSGGLAWGLDPAHHAEIAHLLRLIGRGHLATGRLFEGHVNAIKLAATYGSPAQLDHVAQRAQAGDLFGLWVTDGPNPLRLEANHLVGGKLFCSGAGHIRHAIVTAQPHESEPVLVLVTLDDPARATPSAIKLQGMRSAVTGAVDLTGLPADIIGQSGDYLRQPLFSAGAWRTSAVTLGGIDALVHAAHTQLAERGRAGDPHQRARMGHAQIAKETAALWVAKAARIAEHPGDPGDIAAYVNLARLAVEAAALQAMHLVQRSLGLSAFVTGQPVEALLRDLATYLRQPAPDETLTETAAWFAAREIPA